MKDKKKEGGGDLERVQIRKEVNLGQGIRGKEMMEEKRKGRKGNRTEWMRAGRMDDEKRAKEGSM